VKIKLPIVTKDELKDGKRVFEYEEREVVFNNTISCQMRWESCFPELAKRESVIDYAARVRELEGRSVGVLISEMKVVYCFLELDMPFTEFIKLFDFSQKEYVEKLIAKIKEAFDVIFDTASEKN
jgi:hypothetical protein